MIFAALSLNHHPAPQGGEMYRTTIERWQQLPASGFVRMHYRKVTPSFVCEHGVNIDGTIFMKMKPRSKDAGPEQKFTGDMSSRKFVEDVMLDFTEHCGELDEFKF